MIDSREKHILNFKKGSVLKEVIKQKLDTGDYSALGYEDKICFERKSPGDACSTLLGGHKRFKRELERAQKLDYFCIIIECSFTRFINKDFPNSHYVRVYGEQLIQTLFTIQEKYGVDLVFCNNRQESASYIRQKLKNYIKNNPLEEEK